MEKHSSSGMQSDRKADHGARVDLAHVADFAIGALRVRPSTREVICGELSHVVEPRVMQVLVALARADGAILSRDDLIHACWDGRIVGEDAINRVISRLRRLSEECGMAFQVETITRVGYRLVHHASAAAATPSTTSPRPDARRRRSVLLAALAALILVAIIAVGWLALRSRSTPVPTLVAGRQADTPMPADSQTAALFLQARQDWALRQSASITRAIGEFGDVIARDPGYAPAYAGLADSYILAREFGALDDATAFTKAKAAAQVGLRIDPTLVGARRAMGFVQYWWDHDPQAAGTSMRRALALAPDDAQSHFWYANILADNGEFAAAFREFDAARGINPESVSIQVDYAWAQWSAGMRDAAVRSLTGIAGANPTLATPHDCLAIIYFADRDYRAYLAELGSVAKLRRSPLLDARLARERAAFAQGPAAFARQLLGEEDPQGRRADPAWSAFVASTLGDRDALAARLSGAVSRHEKWGSAGEVAQIARAWATDPGVMNLLAALKAPHIIAA